MARGGEALPLRHAIALGALQGPVELVPVSSSGHLVLVPAVLGWPYARLDAELRKAFEVAVHAGTALGLLVVLREDLAPGGTDGRAALRDVLACAPPALTGWLLERPIEERLADPRQVAVAQLVAGGALAAADRMPVARPYEAAGLVDHLLLGIAQAAALVPGVSRSGAALTAARLRRLDRRAAIRLSRRTVLPIIVGAAALKGMRIARRGISPELAAAFVAGAAAAFASTLIAGRLLARREPPRFLAAVAAYRIGLGAVALIVMRREPAAPSA
jgi:undecaprenyl-diphosphatase